MTVLEAALIVLGKSGKPLSVAQIYSKIQDMGIYTFRAKDPKAVVSAALRKAVKMEMDDKILRRNDNGTYEVL